MSAVQEELPVCLSEQAWQQLVSLESLHRELLRNHERVQRTLDEAALSSDRNELMIAWEPVPPPWSRTWAG